MQFLKTLFWVVLAVVVVIFSTHNWQNVTLNLWGGLKADVKLPALLMFVFLLGFLPTFLIYRARLWALRRRLEPAERRVSVATPAPPPPAPAAEPGAPERVATDSKVWPAS